MTGWRLTSSMPAMMRCLSSCFDVTRIWRSKLLDAAYPASTAIKLILDNHSAHISRETRAWLDTRPPGRFDFTFTPKHGSWLNLIEGFFSKFARSVQTHLLWMLVEPTLNCLKNVLTLPPADPPLLAGGAALLDGTTLTGVGPVAA